MGESWNSLLYLLLGWLLSADFYNFGMIMLVLQQCFNYSTIVSTAFLIVTFSPSCCDGIQMTGTPVSGKKRLQFNLPFMPIEKLNVMKNVGTFLAPLMWVEEGATLPDDFQAELIGVFRMLRRITITKWLIVIGLLSVMGTAIALHYKQFETVDVSPSQMVKPTATHVQPVDAADITKTEEKSPDNYDKY